MHSDGGLEMAVCSSPEQPGKRVVIGELSRSDWPMGASVGESLDG